MTTTSDRQQAPHVIPLIEQEFTDFKTEAAEFLAGNRDEKKFIGFRLKQGVYGQRQAARQMTRVKLPFGGVTPMQLEGFAQVAERFAPLGKGHITTRQNIQFHHFRLAEAYDLLKVLAAHGLSTREACGNVVRNVTGDPWAGIRPEEPFDITPYAGAFVRYWVRNPLSQLLPRKFKVTFSASEVDAAMTAIHDIGFIPRVRVESGKEVRGFKMVVGGGLSTMAKEAVLLSEFVPVDQFLTYSEAVIRIFEDASELRKDIHKARLKFLVHRVGAEAFRKMVDERLAQDWAKQVPPLEALMYVDDERALAPAPSTLDVDTVPAGDRPAFQKWVDDNVRAHRQAGYYAVEAKVPQGDLTAPQFRGLAQILTTFGAGRARMTQDQNIVLRWIPGANLYPVWQALQPLGLGGAGVQTIEDVVSCPGTDSCKLGITASMGLNRAITAQLQTMNITDPLTRKVLINISGCPNSCGQHHLGNIGFHGAAMKNDDRQIPAYNVFLGGMRREGEKLQFGSVARLRIPAKRVPVAIERFISVYEGGREDGEEFNAFVDRVGIKPFETAVQDLSVTPKFATDSFQEFIDWEREGLYVLERGEGECAV
ncbi:MAG: nitrite/sulfite reductase [Dehalococcoidia bacterium]|nr:MAG: nitrite/sulfite reductase [Dehalococcoidia bacterium]